MSKTEFLKSVKRLLKSIVSQRTYLLNHNKSHLESNFVKQEVSNIQYALPRLVDANRAKAYLERKETALRYLIPASNPKRHEELRQLINEQLN